MKIRQLTKQKQDKLLTIRLLIKIEKKGVFRQSDGWRYVFVADFGAFHCQATMKFEASHNL